MISAQVQADSITPGGKRLTTFVLTYPRFIHSEFMTHRMFSRNASSSRAIPVQKQVEAIQNDPAMPTYWGKNQPGMQAAEELNAEEQAEARQIILEMRDFVLKGTARLAKIGLHKQATNRYAEPWAHITVILSATEFGNFYNLRHHPDADPTMQALASAMLNAHNASTPVFRKYGVPSADGMHTDGNWHLPFISDDERASNPVATLLKASVARCARVSYLNHDGTNPDIEKDAKLHDRLASSGHVSPFEHQAFPDEMSEYGIISEEQSNFRGWVQYRSLIPNQNRPVFPGLK